MVENRVLQSERQRLEKEQTSLSTELLRWREGHESLCQEMLRMARELTASRQRAQLLENTVATLSEERKVWERETSGMQSQMEENRKRISALEETTQGWNAERDVLLREVLQLQKQQVVQTAELESGEAKIRQLQNERAGACRRVSELTDLLRSAEQRNQNLLESWSWRFTRPLRWIERFVHR